MAPWRRDQRRQTADECQRREREAGLPVGSWLRQVVDDPRQGERWAGAVAQQPFQTGVVVPFDAHRAIQGEKSAGSGFSR